MHGTVPWRGQQERQGRASTTDSDPWKTLQVGGLCSCDGVLKPSASCSGWVHGGLSLPTGLSAISADIPKRRLPCAPYATSEQPMARGVQEVEQQCLRGLKPTQRLRALFDEGFAAHRFQACAAGATSSGPRAGHERARARSVFVPRIAGETRFLSSYTLPSSVRDVEMGSRCDKHFRAGR